MADGFTRRVIMTGTPVANRPFDLWAQIKFLDGGHALGESFASFRSALDLSNKLGVDRNRRGTFEATLAGLYKKLASFTVRETKVSSRLSLPGKEISNIPVELVVE